LGPQVVDIEAPDLQKAYREVCEADVDRLLGHLSAQKWRIIEDWPELRASVRLAVTLEGLCRIHAADGGAVNCHGPLFRENSATGIVACLGVSLLSAEGRPFACTGDLPAALALRIGKELTGSALYCEYYAREGDSGLILIAAGGEGDTTISQADAPIEVYPNRHYPGLNGCGACVKFRLRPGPATILSFSPTSGGWRLIWATGDVIESYFPGMTGPNALFRFSQGSSSACVKWALHTIMLSSQVTLGTSSMFLLGWSALKAFQLSREQDFLGGVCRNYSRCDPDATPAK
jgi:L-arabinose isomerase